MGAPIFLPTHSDSDKAGGFVCFPVVVYINDKLSEVKHVANGSTYASRRLARLEASPTRAAAMAKARQRLGQWIAEEKLAQGGLTALRLKAGLSQKNLADLLGTKQSNVSRMEKAPGDMQFSTIKSLAKALKITVNEVCDAIDETTKLEAQSEH